MRIFSKRRKQKYWSETAQNKEKPKEIDLRTKTGGMQAKTPQSPWSTRTDLRCGKWHYSPHTLGTGPCQRGPLASAPRVPKPVVVNYQLNAEEGGVGGGHGQSWVCTKTKLKLTQGCNQRSAATQVMQKGFPHLSLIHSYPLGCGEPLMIFDVIHSVPQVAVPLGQVDLDLIFQSWTDGREIRILPAISSATDPSGLTRSVRGSEPEKGNDKKDGKKVPVADLSSTQFFLAPAPPQPVCGQPKANGKLNS